MSITRGEPRHPVGRGARVEHHPMSITRREPKQFDELGIGHTLPLDHFLHLGLFLGLSPFGNLDRTLLLLYPV